MYIKLYVTVTRGFIVTNMKDIAFLTGVSVNTVSRALMDKPDIGEDTKRRIRQAAEQLKYTPNFIARGLATRRSFTIGMVASDISNPIRGALIDETRRLVAGKGYQLFVGGYDSEGELGERIREMCARSVDGLLVGNIGGILSEKPYWPSIEAAEGAGIPVVAFYNAVTTRIDNISADYPAFAEAMTRHLVEKHGLKKILFAGVVSEHERMRGYEEAMRKSGLSGEIGTVPLEGWTLQSARRGILDFLDANPPPQGIVCRNDLAAVGIMSGLRERGLRVPEDVAVAGIDNIELADFLAPKLTTAGIPPAKVADELFKLLLDRMEGKYSGPARQTSLPFELFIRESCGCGGTVTGKAGPAKPARGRSRDKNRK